MAGPLVAPPPSSSWPSRSPVPRSIASPRKTTTCRHPSLVALRYRGRRSRRQGGWGKAGAVAMEAVRVEESERRRAKEEVGRRLEGWPAALSARLGGDDGDEGRRGGR
uniref:DUF834 domain-containing protein n=1 Tax=Oryza meridionalis TaxID=40149 RepID=A0A0E0CJK5_9ORYZ